MFIVLTADDAIQTYTTAAIDSLVKKRRNPNGCDIKVRKRRGSREVLVCSLISRKREH